ncbi:MAG: SCO family protein [Anaerolineales bacterium]|nr:SCO family protein [Anaerolineales bacterium]NUQ83896.1 SCO family protein [Anaerolineales bacterium]
MDRKTLLVGLGSLVLIGMVAAWTVFFVKPAGFRGTIYTEPYPPASDFTLARADGSRFQLSGMRGKVVLLFFGYTSCPDICPTTLAELNQAMKGLKAEEAARVQVVFVTVDPGRDTPERAQEYVNHFNPDFIGLSGPEEELSKVWNAYGVFREIVEGTSAAGYLVNHTARVTLVDGNGNLRLSFGFDTPVEDIVHDLKLILKEGG